MTKEKMPSQFDDPMFTGEKYQPNFLGMSPAMAQGGIYMLVLALVINGIGWKAACAVGFGLILLWILLRILRKKQIAAASKAGYVNKFGQITEKCQTPGWKAAQSFYRLKCQFCGHEYDVRADRIRRKKCPACQEK